MASYKLSISLTQTTENNYSSDTPPVATEKWSLKELNFGPSSGLQMNFEPPLVSINSARYGSTSKRTLQFCWVSKVCTETQRVYTKVNIMTRHGATQVLDL